MTDRTCTVDGCPKRASARGWCWMHYSRWKRHGDLERGLPERINVGQICAVEHCEEPARTRGWCGLHYERWRLEGDPGEPDRRIPPPPGQCSVETCGCHAVARGLCSRHWQRQMKLGSTALVSGCVVCGEPGVSTRQRRDLCRQHYEKWALEELVAGRWHTSRNSDGYEYGRINGTHGRQSYFMHRVAMERYLGRSLQPGETIHHKNGIRHDNRLENLELWVSPQRSGQRVEDLVAWVVDQYPEYVAAALNDETQLRLIV